MSYKMHWCFENEFQKTENQEAEEKDAEAIKTEPVFKNSPPDINDKNVSDHAIPLNIESNELAKEKSASQNVGQLHKNAKFKAYL